MIAWLHGFRRLRIRQERREGIHEAFLGLATCLITYRHVQRLYQDPLVFQYGFVIHGWRMRQVATATFPGAAGERRGLLASTVP